MWRELFALTYRHLRRMGASHADAEDLAQEALMAACLNIEGIDPGKLSAWLRAAARNKMVDRYRRSGRTVPLESAMMQEDLAGSPEAVVLSGDEHARLREAIARLPPRDALLIEEHYLEEKPLSRIADEQGLSMAATKVALFRARQRLRKALRTEEER